MSLRLAIGTAQFGLCYGVANTTGQVSFKESSDILLKAKNAGIETLDTAISYGNSEQVLGEIGVRSWQVVSKLPEVPSGEPNIVSWVRQQAQSSLERMRINRLYGFLLHKPMQLLGAKGDYIYAALQALKEEGLVEKVGVSVYDPTELDIIFQKYTFDIVQAPLNIFDRRLECSGWAKQLSHSGVVIHTRSAFLQGLLLLPKNKRPPQFKPWNEVFSEWDRWLAKSEITALEACLRYVNGVSDIDCTVIGIDSKEQLDSILRAIKGPLPVLPKFKTFEDMRLINPASWSDL